MVDGLTAAELGKPEYIKAVQQHEAYCEALRKCGLDVLTLPADERYPDSTFVEDTALLTPRCAIMTNPGAESRRGEVNSIREAVAPFYDEIEEIAPPGTVEAGDIMMVGRHFYIGRSERTNEEGARQMIDVLRRYGMDGSAVHMKDVLHLKTAVNYLEHNRLLMTHHFLGEPQFRDYEKLRVNDDEAYAANSLWVNDRVVVPAGNPNTKQMIESLGYAALKVDTSEFRKIDGGLSCLSLRF